MSKFAVELIKCDSIQEGMVFVSMSSSDLLARTAQYQMRDSSPLRESEDLEPLYFDDVNESRPLSRRRDSSAQRIVPPPISDSAAHSYRPDNTRSTGSSTHPLPLIEVRDDLTPLSQPSTLPEPSEFTVTTSGNDPSSDEEEPSSPATLADRLRRDSLPSPFELSSDEDTEAGLERVVRRTRVMGIPSSHSYYRRCSRRTDPSRIEIVGAADVSGDGTENKEVLTPHACFFIERTRRCVTSEQCYHTPYSIFDHETRFASQKYSLLFRTLTSQTITVWSVLNLIHLCEYPWVFLISPYSRQALSMTR